MLGVARPRAIRVVGLSYPDVDEDQVVQSLVEDKEVLKSCRARLAMLPTSLCCLAISFSSVGSFFSTMEWSPSSSLVSEKMLPPYFLMSLPQPLLLDERGGSKATLPLVGLPLKGREGVGHVHLSTFLSCFSLAMALLLPFLSSSPEEFKDSSSC